MVRWINNGTGTEDEVTETEEEVTNIEGEDNQALTDQTLSQDVRCAEVGKRPRRTEEGKMHGNSNMGEPEEPEDDSEEKKGYSQMYLLFWEFSERRKGIIKALTSDVAKFTQAVEEFHQQGEGCICLYGYNDGGWKVRKPREGCPPVCPEPDHRILRKVCKDCIGAEKWIYSVAEYSDAWLLSSIFFDGYQMHLDKSMRSRLFSMISNLKTVYEEVKQFCTQKEEVKRFTN